MSNPYEGIDPSFFGIGQSAPAVQTEQAIVNPNQPLVDIGLGEMQQPATFTNSAVFSEEPRIAIPTLGFGITFQTKALAMLVRSQGLLADYVDVFNAAYFESTMHRNLARLIFAYYRESRITPLKGTMIDLIAHDCAKLRTTDEYKTGLANIIEEMYEIDLSDEGWLKKRIVNFCRKHALMQYAAKLIQSVEAFDAGGGDDFEQALSPAIRKIASIGSPGTYGFDMSLRFEDLPAELTNSTSYASGFKVPSGIRLIDHATNGGLTAGNIAFIGGGAGVGKSTMLVQVAAGAIAAKVNVMVFTLELKEEDWGLRLAQRFTDVGMNHVIQNSERYRFRKPFLKEMLSGVHVIFKYFPPSTASVDTLRNHMSKEVSRRENNGRPWLIIVDYVEKMKMADSNKTAEHQTVGVAVDELIGFGAEFNAPVWTATQVNRAGFKKVAGSKGQAHYTKDDIATSWKKVEAADLLVFLNQSEHEKALGEARLWIVKNRRGKDNISCKMIDNRPTMNMIECMGTDLNNQVVSYSPQRDQNFITLRQTEWFGEDESAYGPLEQRDTRSLLQPPDFEIQMYRQEQAESLNRETVGIDQAQIDAVADSGPVPDPILHASMEATIETNLEVEEKNDLKAAQRTITPPTLVGMGWEAED